MERKKWYERLEEMQSDLDEYLLTYNSKRPHQGYGKNGRTPKAVFKAGLIKPKKPTKTTQKIAA